MGQSTPWEKSAASGPLKRRVEIVNGPLPVFVSVTSCASVFVPTTWSRNVSDVRERVAIPAPPAIPPPVSATVCGLEGASSPIS